MKFFQSAIKKADELGLLSGKSTWEDTASNNEVMLEILQGALNAQWKAAPLIGTINTQLKVIDMASSQGDAKMIQVEWGPENEFIIVHGADEFAWKIEKNSTFEVVGFLDGKSYYVHEIGEQLYVLSDHAQTALARLADLVIEGAAEKRWY
jgi:hypothetical protein